MKKIVLLLILLSSILLGETKGTVYLLEETTIKTSTGTVTVYTYCVDGYMFVKTATTPFVQVMEGSSGKSLPKVCE